MQDLKIAVAPANNIDEPVWLTAPAVDFARITARDLGHAWNMTGRGAPTAVDNDNALLTISAVLADSNREAALAYESLTATATPTTVGPMPYVGTVRGLMGLICDVRALEIAAGAWVIVRSAPWSREHTIRALGAELPVAQETSLSLHS